MHGTAGRWSPSISVAKNGSGEDRTLGSAMVKILKRRTENEERRRARKKGLNSLVFAGMWARPLLVVTRDRDSAPKARKVLRGFSIANNENEGLNAILRVTTTSRVP